MISCWQNHSEPERLHQVTLEMYQIMAMLLSVEQLYIITWDKGRKLQATVLQHLLLHRNSTPSTFTKFLLENPVIRTGIHGIKNFTWNISLCRFRRAFWILVMHDILLHYWQDKLCLWNSPTFCYHTAHLHQGTRTQVKGSSVVFLQKPDLKAAQ